MTGYLGTFALAVGLLAAVASVGLWAREATGGGTRSLARQGAWLMLLGAAGAVAVLEWALLTDDFSVRFVAENGSASTPLYYTVTSLWAASDGSLLLWLLVLTGYLLVAALRPPRAARRLHPWAMAVLSLVAAFFFGLVLFTGHAFDTVAPPPNDGPGPNPLLRDHPAMGIHPPLLYAGFLGLAVPFAFAVAALITGDVGRDWLRAVRTYTLVAWTALTAGIVLGAWWSYAVLGWGGYWAWDPVENASLVPWLVATALLHSSMVQRSRAALPAWNLSLAVAAFLLACLGTFLTRSSVVVSVHAFAESAVGPLLLGLVTALTVAVAVLVLLRTDRLGSPGSVGPLLSRGTFLLANNVLLCCLAFVVLLGTLFPLVVELLEGRQVSVGPPYYNRMAVPLGLLLLTMMAVGPMLRWRGDDADRLLGRLALPATAGALVVVTLVLVGVHNPAALAAFGLATLVAGTVVDDLVEGLRRARAGSSGWRAALRATLVRRRARNAGMLAHLGIAVAVVGIAASSVGTVSAERRLEVGERMTLAGVTAQLREVERERTEQVMSTAAVLEVGEDGHRTTATAALRFFPAHAMTVAQPAVLGGARRDVYLTLLAVDQASGTATVRLAVNPLVGWIWAGGAMVTLGGALALWPGRRRPLRRAQQHPREGAHAETLEAVTR